MTNISTTSIALHVVYVMSFSNQAMITVCTAHYSSAVCTRNRQQTRHFHFAHRSRADRPAMPTWRNRVTIRTDRQQHSESSEQNSIISRTIRTISKWTVWNRNEWPSDVRRTARIAFQVFSLPLIFPVTMEIIHRHSLLIKAHRILNNALNVIEHRSSIINYVSWKHFLPRTITLTPKAWRSYLRRLN